MGFTITQYQLLGLPPLPNIYVSIQGSFTIKKNHPVLYDYSIIFTTYYSSSKLQPVITQKEMCINLQELPQPADLYTVIYNNIKQQLNTNDDLVFVDDL